MSRRRNASRRGFAIGPILFLITLIGILGGVLFSNNMQLIRSNVIVQNSVSVRTELQASATTLAALSVFSTDGLTFCPPRSIHQTTGEPCAATPIGLIQFSDLPASDTARLPGNYAAAGSTGSPVEVGVFSPGAGTHMIDPYGHLYIYCRWENPRSNPAAPAFVLLSAGDDGVLQTKCGDTVAQSDDYLYSLSVAEATNRAAVWQVNDSTSVTYGATGSQVVIDNSGNMTATNITASNNATVANNLTTNTFNALSATVSGTASAGTLNAGSASVSGTISASTGNFGNVTASGTVSGSTGSFTNINADSATVTGGISAASLTTTGDVTAKNLIASNNVTGANGSFIGLNAQSLAVTNGITAASLAATGDVTAQDVIASNNVNGATGNFTTGNFNTVNTTNINTTNETITGTLTAGNFSFSGTGSAASGVFTNLTATNATITNTLAANAFTASSATVSGTVSGSTGSFTNLTATNANITNTLTANNETVTTSNISTLNADNETTTNSTITNLSADNAYFDTATFYWPLMWYGNQLLKLTDYGDGRIKFMRLQRRIQQHTNCKHHRPDVLVFLL